MKLNVPIFVKFVGAVLVGGVLCIPVLAFLGGLVASRVMSSPVPAIRNECSLYLKVWFTGQRAYFMEKDAYSPLTARVGFSPERGNHFAYFSGPGPLEDRSAETALVDPRAEGIGADTARRSVRAVTFAQLPPDVASSLGLSGECPRCDITLACAGDIDEDGVVEEVWTVSTRERQAANGSTIPQGVPFRHAQRK